MKQTPKHLSFVKLSTVGTVILILAISQTAAHSPNAPLSADEITRTLRGKICSTRVGAKFAFGQDGQYSYDGLWKNNGSFTVSAGAITIMLDNGLERSFIISRKGDVFFIEQTALSCDQIGRSGS